MIYFLTASKDATIYSVSPLKNTGLDQLIEVANIVGTPTTTGVSRGLIKFDLDNIKQYVTANNITISDVRFILKETLTSNVPLEFMMNIEPISGSWEMGDGFLYSSTSTGVSWKYRNTTLTSSWTNGQFSNVSTGSNLDGSGGAWYKNYTLTQSYSYKTIDLNVNIKSIFDAWYSNTISNDGLLLKLSNDNEFSTKNIKLNFYSTETNTIHKPMLSIGWIDSSFNTGSLTALQTDNIKIKLTNLKNKYLINNFYRFNVEGVLLYPSKTFTTTFTRDVKYLPSTSYYQIRDTLTGNIVIPFSDYTKISCDANGNYFKINFINWVPRKYTIDFKIVNNDDTQYYMNNNVFEVM